MKLLKLSFQNKEEWLTLKATLLNDGTYTSGIKDVFELGHLQKAPENEGDEWGLYEDYSVDMLVETEFDYTALKQYLANISGRPLHSITGGKAEIVTANTQ